MEFSLYSVMAPDMTPEAIIGYLKETGYSAVEWRLKDTPAELKQEAPSFWRNNLCTISPDITNQEIENLKSAAKHNGINILSVLPYLTAGDLKATEHALQIAQKLGAVTIRLGVPSYDRSQHYNDLFRAAAAYLYEAEQMCKQYKVKGLIETHHGTIAPSASLAHRLVCPFDSANIGVLYDPGNMVHEGYENHRMGLELLGDYLAHVHVKNARWQKEQQYADGTVDWSVEWTSIEKGVVNWKQVLSDLKAVGYNGYIGMEDFSASMPVKESVKHNIETVNQFLAENEAPRDFS
ncbi:Sugar phosphate isomerase/epimerase [Terribacillus aidingensis]|uniref:Sugar phosphate isomerase/epimerase n=1 Tax=Terribacillus aidingensis TaxID=586416 RepID=A0A285PBG6_9BACI|nr:sugar phosphate isomerase/epimerase family protein [Terribacillus aidingensis]SNZ17476.1 Sugar phosphate isomerase/epimerase [Terribacillus aidingensis]